MATEKLSEYLERDIDRESIANLKICVQDKAKLVDWYTDPNIAV